MVLGISVPLLLFEAGLRVVGYQAFQWSDKVNTRILTATNNAELPYVLTPNAEGWGWETHIAVNSYGFRDREFSEAKGNRFRIAAIGDSITFGSRLSLPSMLYPKQLERLLQSRLPSTNIEVLNFGVTGYDVVNNVEHLRVRALKFQPDIVLLGFCANDIGTASTAMGYVRAAQYLGNPVFRLRASQFMLSTALKQMAAKQANDDQNIDVFARVNRSRILPIEGDAVLLAKVAEIAKLTHGRTAPGLLKWWTQTPRIGFLEYGFNKLRELKLRHGFDVVVVGIPVLDRREKEQWRLVNQIIRHESLKFGFHFVDVFEPFEKAGLRRLRNEPDDEIHPNVDGHAIIAKEVNRYLATSDLLTASSQ